MRNWFVFRLLSKIQIIFLFQPCFSITSSQQVISSLIIYDAMFVPVAFHKHTARQVLCLGKYAIKIKPFSWKRVLLQKKRENTIRVRSALEWGTKQAEVLWGKRTEELPGKNLGHHI